MGEFGVGISAAVAALGACIAYFAEVVRLAVTDSAHVELDGQGASLGSQRKTPTLKFATLSPMEAPLRIRIHEMEECLTAATSTQTLVIDANEFETKFGAKITAHTLTGQLYQMILDTMGKELITKIDETKPKEIQLKDFDKLAQGKLSNYLFTICGAVTNVLDHAAAKGIKITTDKSLPVDFPKNIVSRISQT